VGYYMYGCINGEHSRVHHKIIVARRKLQAGQTLTLKPSPFFYATHIHHCAALLTHTCTGRAAQGRLGGQQ